MYDVWFYVVGYQNTVHRDKFIVMAMEVSNVWFYVAGYQNTVHKDKFLVMAMEIANESNESMVELWKSAQRESIMEHRFVESWL